MLTISGRGSYVLKEKLKSLKGALKRFKEVTGMLIDGDWVEQLIRVKDHFRSLFQAISGLDGFNYSFTRHSWDILKSDIISMNFADNAVTLRIILKCFHMMSSLKINFHKSNFIGVKSKHNFVHLEIEKLCCEKGSIPFKFLGIHVGANPNRLFMWSSVIASLKKKLSL
ncbi:hypothetical protein Lal_00003766 [Lupinus albus]|nr:hypothetical protein Lal_00003766 [Lupinus albus]